jgi:hypothetical protein
MPCPGEHNLPIQGPRIAASEVSILLASTYEGSKSACAVNVTHFERKHSQHRVNLLLLLLEQQLWFQ